MVSGIDSGMQSDLPKKPFIAGLWLIAALPLVVIIMFSLNTWIHRQSIVNSIGLPLAGLVFAGSAYLWANTLLRRSGWRASWKTGLAGAIALVATILGVEFGGYKPLFSTLMKVFNVTQTEAGSRPEFYVVFVTWTGLVTGGCGFAVGLALRKFKLAMKLLGLGLVCGTVVFAAVAIGMDWIGFRVGTARPDGLPSMPIVTILGVWVTALVGSQLFGHLLVMHRSSGLEIGTAQAGAGAAPAD